MKVKQENGSKKTNFEVEVGDEVIMTLIRYMTPIGLAFLCKLLEIDFSILVQLFGLFKALK